MAILRNNFLYAGSVGDDITTGSSAAGGDAFSTVNAGANAAEYSTAVANPFTGGTVLKVQAAAAVAGEVRWTVSSTNTCAAQIVYWATADPTTASNDDLTIRGTVQNAGIRHHTGSQRRVINLGSEIGGGASYAGVLGAWVVEDLVVLEGTTSGNGTIKSRIRLLSDLTTVLNSYTSSARNAGVIGTDVINSIRFGKTTTASVQPALYFAMVAADPAATDWLPDPSVGATVLAVRATATALAEPPAVSGEVVIPSGGPATATALASAPVVTGGASVTAVRATSTAAAGVPVITGGAIVTGVRATATALATPPVISAAATGNVVAVRATATALASPPTVLGGATVVEVKAAASAVAYAPFTSGGAIASAIVGTASAFAPAPYVGGPPPTHPLPWTLAVTTTTRTLSATPVDRELSITHQERELAVAASARELTVSSDTRTLRVVEEP